MFSPRSFGLAASLHWIAPVPLSCERDPIRFPLEVSSGSIRDGRPFEFGWKGTWKRKDRIGSDLQKSTMATMKLVSAHPSKGIWRTSKPCARSRKVLARSQKTEEEAQEALEELRRQRLTNEEWEAKFVRNGRVSLWVEDDFATAWKRARGYGSGEGPSKGNCPVHKVKVEDPDTGEIMELDAPEDRYVLFEAEDQGLDLPFACRMGCCTSCAVKVKSGTLDQPEALGISPKLKEDGYALLCVAFPKSDLEVVLQDEDEVYDKQFGKSFAQRALNKQNRDYVERDDFALEIADMDE